MEAGLSCIQGLCCPSDQASLHAFFSAPQLPYRYHSSAPLLHSSPQPKSVARSRGRHRWSTEGNIPQVQCLFPVSPENSVPSQVKSKGKGVAIACFVLSILSAGVRSFQVCKGFCETQPCLPALLRRIKVRHSV